MIAEDCTMGQIKSSFKGGSKVHATAGLEQAESTNRGLIEVTVHCVTPEHRQNTRPRKKVNFCRVIMHANP